MSVLDRRNLDELRLLAVDGEPCPAAEMVAIYLREAQAQLQLVHQANGLQDYLALARCVHRLKGGAAAIGAYALADVAGQVVTLCAQDSLSVRSMSEIQALLQLRLEDLNAKSDEAMVALQRYVEEHRLAMPLVV